MRCAASWLRAIPPVIVAVAVSAALAGAQDCEITCPSAISVSNDPDQCGAVVNYSDPSLVGECGAVQCSPSSGFFFPVGMTEVTCTTDAGPSCSFSITVVDTQPPQIVCPLDITAPNDPGQCSAVLAFMPEATDNCPGVTVACSPESGSSFPVGMTFVTCTATDAAGNTGSCTFTATVADVEAPVVDVPPDQQRLTTGGRPVPVSYPPASATDNCPNVGPTTCEPPSGSLFPPGVTTVGCMATDAAGNTGFATFLVIVSHAAPVLGAGMLVMLCVGLAVVAVRKLRARA
jgi:hypothetical protein